MKCKFCSYPLIKTDYGYFCKKCKHLFPTSNILDFYEQLGWVLIKLRPEQKIPAGDKWQNSDKKKDWIKWLKDGYNIGLNLEFSNVTVIDFDNHEIYDKVKENFNPTLTQKTPHGYHLIYQKWDINPANLRPLFPIEIKGNGQQIVLEPSITDGIKREFIERISPVEISEVSKRWLAERIGSRPSTPKIQYNVIPQGQRHYTLISMGGHFKNLGFYPQQIFHILDYVNHHFTVQPKPAEELKHICDSLWGYKLSEDEQTKREIVEYIQTSQEASKAEIEIALFNNRVKGKKKKNLDRLLVELMREKRIYKENKMYKIFEDPLWNDNLEEAQSVPINWKMPYFYDCANFMVGDVILVSAQTGAGKTHIAVNIIKRLIDQGIKPYLFETEPGKRFSRIAFNLGISPRQFYFNTKVVNPLNIEIANNSVNVIDWLDPAKEADWTQTSKIFNYFSTQALERHANFIVFMQLRNDMKQFAKDLVNQYPSFSVNFSLEENRANGKFTVIKNNDPKLPYIFEIPTIFDPVTKILKRMDEKEIGVKE